MIKAFCNFVKISVTVLVMTVLLSAISLKYICRLSVDNYDLRRQVEGSSQTTACQLHVSVLPIFGIHWLTYDFPMEIPAGEELPIIQFEDCFFLSLSVTAPAITAA
jgi:hypothetical protein